MTQGRPPGEIRRALRAAAQQAARESGAATWRELAQRSGVGYLAAKAATRDMLRSGELQCVGHVKAAHSRRWLNLYQPAEPAARSDATPAQMAVADVMQRWVAGK